MELTLPNKVQALGENCFAGCSGLPEVNLPASLTDISAYAFYACTSLEKIGYRGNADSWSAVNIVSTGNSIFTEIAITYLT